MIAYRSVLASGSPTPPTPTGTVYGFHIDSTISDSSNAVTYIEDAVGMTPAHMDFTNDVFDYGSWENAFFMPKPCMLKYDGTVDYYLDPDDYSKKEDGTPSDVSDPTYAGNAMMEWGQNGKKIWVKYEADANDPYSGNVYISDTQMDEHYHDWSFHNSAGVSGDHFYTAIYDGHFNVNGSTDKLRSLSGLTSMTNKKTLAQNVTLAEANNTTVNAEWSIECFADVSLIYVLSILIFKSLDIQTSLGKGLYGGQYSEAVMNAFETGVHNDKGLFYGTDSNVYNVYTNAVKLFGMENYYAFVRRWLLGLQTYYGFYRAKFTYGKEDGSLKEGYDKNYTGDGYIALSKNPMNNNYGWLQYMTFSESALVPAGYGGNQTTYYMTYITANIGNQYLPTISDYKNSSLYQFNSDTSTGSYQWYLGARLSCKPVLSN